MTALISKPGITGASTLAIPKIWDQNWFRGFVNNQLKLADLRNATTDGNIVVTGNVTGYGNIALNGTAGIVLGSATGGAKGAGTINLSGGLYINGVAVALSGVTILKATTNETRTSVTVPSNSTQLTVALVPGTYEFELIVRLQQNGAGAIGVNLNVNYSGTITSSIVYYTYVSQVNSPGVGVAASVATTESTIGTLSNGFDEPFLIKGFMTVSTAGTFAFAFAQNTSSASTTQLIGNATNPSTMVIRRIA